MKDNNELEQYWSQRYIDQSTGWDLGAISEPLRHYIDQLEDKQVRILLPGAGNAYEAEYLHNAGFVNTYILDISEHPLRSFKERVPDFPSAHIVHGDFFELKDNFDLILEQTFFCSFPPVDNNRERYITKMHELLNPKGKLAGLWFNLPFTGDLTKRPFGCSKDEYLRLFSSHFNTKAFEEATNSVQDREGIEFFGIFERKRILE